MVRRTCRRGSLPLGRGDDIMIQYSIWLKCDRLNEFFCEHEDSWSRQHRRPIAVDVTSARSADMGKVGALVYFCALLTNKNHH